MWKPAVVIGVLSVVLFFGGGESKYFLDVQAFVDGRPIANVPIEVEKI